jgi:hypothetical protein
MKVKPKSPRSEESAVIVLLKKVRSPVIIIIRRAFCFDIAKGLAIF